MGLYHLLGFITGRDSLKWLLDQLFAVILLAFELCNVLIKAPSEDLHFPYITAREDNILV